MEFINFKLLYVKCYNKLKFFFNVIKFQNCWKIRDRKKSIYNPIAVLLIIFIYLFKILVK